MATLIAVYTSEGCVGRCDARCYEATEAQCNSLRVCGGRPRAHGAGLEQAVDNTRELAQQWLDAYAQQNGLTEWWADVPAAAPVQLALL